MCIHEYTCDSDLLLMGDFEGCRVVLVTTKTFRSFLTLLLLCSEILADSDRFGDIQKVVSDCFVPANFSQWSFLAKCNGSNAKRTEVCYINT